MSDRLKFRAWIIKDKKIVDVEILHPEYIKDYDGNIYLKKEFILKQCIGLRDKNGNLIYKGDIVKQSLLIDMDSYSGGENTYIDMDIIGVVSITMSRGAVINRPRIFITTDPYKDKQKEERGYTSRHLVASRCEVIGNIHENKDLLDE